MEMVGTRITRIKEDRLTDGEMVWLTNSTDEYKGGSWDTDHTDWTEEHGWKRWACR